MRSGRFPRAPRPDRPRSIDTGKQPDESWPPWSWTFPEDKPGPETAPPKPRRKRKTKAKAPQSRRSSSPNWGRPLGEVEMQAHDGSVERFVFVEAPPAPAPRPRKKGFIKRIREWISGPEEAD